MTSQYDLVEDHLRTLTGSTIRVKIIFSLYYHGSQAVSELSARVGADTSTLLHAIKPLQNGGLVGRGPTYELTHTGHIKALFLSELISGLAAVSQNEQFWQSHDLSGIPTYLLARLGRLEGGICIQDEPNNLLRSQAVFIENVSKAKRIAGVSPIIAPGYTDMVSSLLEGGASVSLILTSSIISIIGPQTIQSWLASGNFRLFEILDGIKVAFTIADDSLFLGLYSNDGTYDPLRDLVCRGQDAVEWGRELFEFYLKQSHPVL